MATMAGGISRRHRRHKALGDLRGTSLGQDIGRSLGVVHRDISLDLGMVHKDISQGLGVAQRDISQGLGMAKIAPCCARAGLSPRYVRTLRLQAPSWACFRLVCGTDLGIPSLLRVECLPPVVQTLPVR